MTPKALYDLVVTVQLRRIYIVLLVLASVPANAHELVPLDLIVNEEHHGEVIVILRNDGDVWIPLGTMQKLNTRLPIKPLVFQKQSYVSLRAHRSRLIFTVDIEKLILRINIQGLYLKPSYINYARELAIETTPIRNSAFVNYSVLYRSSADQSFNTWEVPLEGVVSVNGLVIKSNYFYRQLFDDTYWTRGLTSVSRDFNQGWERLTLGDYFATSGDLGGSGIFSGVSYSHNLSSNIMSYSNPGLSVNGILETPSRVDVYANGMLVRSEDLPAGPYTLDNIPNVFGAGDASLVVTDAFGRKKTFAQSYYVSSQLLQKGLSEFMYSFGWRRNQVDAISLEYEASPSVLAYHKKGLTRFLTLGYRLDWDADLWNIRPTAIFLLNRYGELQLLGAYSHYQRHNGYAFNGRYTYVGRRFHLRAAITYLDPFFAHASYKPETQVSHLTQNYSIGIHGHRLGSLSFIYARTTMQENELVENSEVYSVLYNRRINRTINLFVRGGQIHREQESESSFMVGLHAILGRRMSSSYSYNRAEEITTNTVAFQRTAPLGRGVGLRARAWKDNIVEEQDGIDGDATLSLKGDHGIVDLNYFRSHDVATSQYQLSGALALIDSHLYLTRPIYDSFGVTDIGGLDNVDVFLSSELMGDTDDGRLLIPNLAAYSPNRIKIDSEDIPVDVSLTTTEQIVVPSNRSGSIIRFPIEHFQAIGGTLLFNDFGVIKTPEFASLTLSDKSTQYESIVGKGGEFYFENIASGKYSATLLYQGQPCVFSLNIPESKEILIDMGEQVCVR